MIARGLAGQSLTEVRTSSRKPLAPRVRRSGGCGEQVREWRITVETLIEVPRGRPLSPWHQWVARPSSREETLDVNVFHVISPPRAQTSSVGSEEQEEVSTLP